MRELIEWICHIRKLFSASHLSPSSGGFKLATNNLVWMSHAAGKRNIHYLLLHLHTLLDFRVPGRQRPHAATRSWLHVSVPTRPVCAKLSVQPKDVQFSRARYHQDLHLRQHRNQQPCSYASGALMIHEGVKAHLNHDIVTCT